MSQFARPTFSAQSYAAFRPSYPQGLYQSILAYHQRSTLSGSLLDLGCGHGLIVRALSPHFKNALAIDPSAGMVEQARRTSEDPKITFRQASAEDLSFAADGEFDVVVAGQAAHWFDYSKVWPNLARVVKKGGTVAFFGYKDNVLLGAEQATVVMEKFVYGFGEVAPGFEGMGPYWEQPGRNILRDSLRSIVPPAKNWTELQRLEHEPGDKATMSEEVAWQLRKTMTLGEIEAYTRTFSCYSKWQEAYPDKKSRKEGGDGDVIDVMWDHMIDVVPEWKALGDKWREAKVESDWGTFLLLARRS
ncbi:methyltransferase domain-containing protein [Trichoderma sp. SZMC 28013]